MASELWSIALSQRCSAADSEDGFWSPPCCPGRGPLTLAASLCVCVRVCMCVAGVLCRAVGSSQVSSGKRGERGAPARRQ